MNLVEEQQRFYRDRVPAQFNRGHEEQAKLASADERAAHVLDEMRAVQTAIRIEVVDEEETHVHTLEIDKGRMAPVDRSERTPFFILNHRLETFPNLRKECGDSVLGFLGALAGLGSEMRLTALRVRNLRALAGTLEFEVTGERGFALRATFGLAQPETPARASIRIEPLVFEALRSGALDAQDAFLAEKIEVEGDLEMAIGVALAVLAPD